MFPEFRTLIHFDTAIYYGLYVFRGLSRVVSLI